MLSQADRDRALLGLSVSSEATVFPRRRFLRYLSRYGAPSCEDVGRSAVCLSFGDPSVGCRWMPEDIRDRAKLAGSWRRSAGYGLYTGSLFTCGRYDGPIWKAADEGDLIYFARRILDGVSGRGLLRPCCLVFHGDQMDPAPGGKWLPRAAHWHMISRVVR